MWFQIQLSSADPWTEVAIDWDATMAYRRYLWSHGLAVAEAMDTAQRGMGLNWPQALELIQRSVTEAKSFTKAPWFFQEWEQTIFNPPEI